jgi:hypothetical protein
MITPLNRSALADLFCVRVLSRTPPCARPIDAAELDYRDTLGTPLTFQYIGLPAAYPERERVVNAAVCNVCPEGKRN